MAQNGHDSTVLVLGVTGPKVRRRRPAARVRVMLELLVCVGKIVKPSWVHGMEVRRLALLAARVTLGAPKTSTD